MKNLDKEIAAQKKEIGNLNTSFTQQISNLNVQIT